MGVQRSGHVCASTGQRCAKVFTLGVTVWVCARRDRGFGFVFCVLCFVDRVKILVIHVNDEVNDTNKKYNFIFILILKS